MSVDAAVTAADGAVLTHGGDSNPEGAYETVAAVAKAAAKHNTPIALMTSMGVTAPSGWAANLLDWKRRGERVVRASGVHYVIVCPGWFGYQSPSDTRVDLRQGDLVKGQPGVNIHHIAQALLHGLADTESNYTLEVFSKPGNPIKTSQDWKEAFNSLEEDEAGSLGGSQDPDGPALTTEPSALQKDIADLA